jgi:hypothetical protein
MGVWGQVVGFVLVHLAECSFKSPRGCVHIKFNFINFVLSVQFANLMPQ